MCICVVIHLFWAHIPMDLLLFTWSLLIESPRFVLIWNISDCRMQPLCFHSTESYFMRCFMSLCSSHKGLLNLLYVIILVSFLPPELLSLVTFVTAVIRMPFHEYRIIWADFSCFYWDAFCTPLITAATSWFCLGLTKLVVTEADVFMVFLFLIRRSFTVCSLAISFSIRCWVS